jgi:invasion protein IalB
MVGRMSFSHLPRLAQSVGLVSGLCLAAMSMAEAQQQRPQAAQQPRATNNAAGTFKLDQFSDWIAAFSGQGRAKVCYAMAEPKERLPKGLKRDPAHIFVSTRVGDGAKNEIAIRLGFATKPREDGTLTVGAAKFALSTEGENAFLKNPAQEAQLLDAMRKGQTVSVQVTSARGNALTDRYILKGFGQAVDRMARECP